MTGVCELSIRLPGSTRFAAGDGPQWSHWYGVKRADLSAFIGVGTIGLFSMLLIGRCFGRISTGSAVAMLAAPLLCWVTELPFLRHRPIWLVESLRLMLVALLLAVVLTVAKCEFDRVMAPLLSLRLLSNNIAQASRIGHVV